jgi:hypothetical protein
VTHDEARNLGLNATQPGQERAQDPPPAETSTASDALIVVAQILVACIGAAALMWPAIVNGYPLVFQDTFFYLNPFSGDGVRHLGRTLGYSLMAGPVFKFFGVWGVVIAQSLVTSALIVRVAALAATRRRDRILYPVAALVAVLLLSGAAKYTSWVMADVTTSWLFLAGALWMMSKRWGDRAAAVTIGFVGILAHNSHIPIAIATAAGVAIVTRLLIKAPHPRKAALSLLALTILSIPLAMAVNRMSGTASGVFQGRNSFLMYRLIDTGVVIPTLDRYCAERKWKSCKYREEFVRHIGKADGWLLFARSSPFFRELGGWEGAEQGDIVAHAMRCCWGEIVVTTALGTWQQFWRIDSGDGLAVVDTRPAHGFLVRFYQQDLPALMKSRQRLGTLMHPTLHPVPEAVLHAVLILLTVGLAMYAWHAERRDVVFLLGSVMLFLMVNALVCAFGSSTHDRYQGRVVWLLPFALAIAIGWLREDGQDPGRPIP